MNTYYGWYAHGIIIIRLLLLLFVVVVVVVVVAVHLVQQKGTTLFCST